MKTFLACVGFVAIVWVIFAIGVAAGVVGSHPVHSTHSNIESVNL